MTDSYIAITIGIMFLILAWSCCCCYVGYNMGRRAVTVTVVEQALADEYFIMPSNGKKIHLYKDCHTIDEVKVKSMKACHHCHGKRLQELAAKKGA